MCMCMRISISINLYETMPVERFSYFYFCERKYVVFHVKENKKYKNVSPIVASYQVLDRFVKRFQRRRFLEIDQS